MTENIVDAAARQHAIDAPGSVLVQAPAGSGKTTLLAQRYLRLLAEIDSPDRILALTFTRRAAQEMRERVMQALLAASGGCPPHMNPQTWSLGVAAMRQMDRLGLDVRQQPSRLRIETIDAFNAWLAGQLPITAGTGSRLQLLEKADAVYEEAARRALAHDEVDVFGAAVERVLELDDQRWRTLVDEISQMLRIRDRWLRLLGGRLQATRALDEAQLRRVRRHMDEDLELLVQRTLSGAKERIGAERLGALSALAHGAARRFEAAPAWIIDWCAGSEPLRAAVADLSRWRALAALLLTKKPAYRKQLTKNEGFPPQCADKAVMLDLIAELERDPEVLRALVEIRAAPEPFYDDAQWERVCAVSQVLMLAAAQLEQVFRQRGAVDFPAVSMAAVNALGTLDAPTDLNLRLDYRLQHILIDEFQDTSSGQLELVELLTAGWQRGDGRSVFCVGDPTQSIYGFREAEVRVFLELAEKGVGDVRFEVERLRSNFRSTRPLVEWINACFARVLPRIDDRERGAIAFRPSEAVLPAASSGETAVTLRGYSTRRAEAEGIAQLIATQTAEHPAWRIAILVRAKSHARDIAIGLRAHGIGFRALDIEPLQERPVVRDLVTLIRALLHAGDRDAWLALLRAPWCGLTLSDLLIVARSGPLIGAALSNAAVLSNLSDDGRERCERLRGTLDAALALRSQDTLARWIERTWLACGGAVCANGAEELEHVNAVFSRLRELDEHGLPDPADLEASFADLYAEHRVPAAVEIMTIHKAKGLEFDLVVVPALDRAISRNRDRLLLSHEFARAGRDGLVMAARPGVGADTDRLFEYLRHQVRDAGALEAERLLYVACTRAKWRLHLTAMIEPRNDAEVGDRTAPRAPWRPSAGSLLAVLWAVVGSDFVLEPEAIMGGERAVAPRGTPLYRVPRGWSLAMLPESPKSVSTDVSAPGLSSAVNDHDAEALPPLPVFDWAGETARRVGSLVHAELQSLDWENSSAALIGERSDHYRRWLALHGVPAERLVVAGQRVVAALTAVLSSSRGAWIFDKGHRKDVREIALSGRWHGDVVRVIFDRSFIDVDGVRWVIDYKTSQHSGGSIEEFLDQEVIRYTPQMSRYAELARKLGPESVRVGLYFPLLDGWREWQP